jgi:cell division protein FtsB
VILLIAFSITIYLVALVLIFGLGYWGLRGLNLKFSELRDEIAAGIQEINEQRKQEEGKSEQT